MSIKHFLVTVFLVLMIFGLYQNYEYLKGLEVEKTTNPIESYDIMDIWCRNSSKMTNTMKIKYKGNEYHVGIYSDNCEDIENGIIKPELYYMEETDDVFCKGQYMPFPYVYLTYIAAFLLPLFGFFVYRKELNNHYSTM